MLWKSLAKLTRDYNNKKSILYDWFYIFNVRIPNRFINGADDGNRTHVVSLEGWSSTIKLHPQKVDIYKYIKKIYYVNDLCKILIDILILKVIATLNQLLQLVWIFTNLIDIFIIVFINTKNYSNYEHIW